MEYLLLSTLRSMPKCVRFLFVALFLSTVLYRLPPHVEGQLTSRTRMDLLNPDFIDIPRYLSIDGVPSVLVAPNIIVILDCYNFGLRMFNVQWNVSALVWSFNGNPIDFDSTRRLMLSNNRIRLTINRTTLESGAESSTDGLYACTACAFDRRCATTSTRVTIFAPPVISVDCSTVPESLGDDTGFLSLTAGCDLCFERGQTIGTLEVTCMPSGVRSRQPIGCNWQIGSELVPSVPGRLDNEFGALTFTDLTNPPESPELDFLKTYTCNCSNSDGFVLASTRIGSCFIIPEIRKGTPRRPFVGTFVPPGFRSVLVGTNESVVAGFDLRIECRVLRGDPPPTIAWFRNDDQIEGQNATVLVVETDDPVAANGTYTCEASNRVGSDSASTDLRYGIELVKAPEIVRGPKLPRPDVNVVGTIRAQVGERVFVIIGERLELFCNISEPVIPSVSYVWFKEGRTINSSSLDDQVLVINQTKEDDVGHYCCRATNTGGRSEVCSFVTPVLSGPILAKQDRSPFPRLPDTVTIAQTTVKIGGSLWTAHGGTGVISCEVFFSNPPVNSIEWFVGEPPVSIDSSSVGDLLNRINITTNLNTSTSLLVIRPTLFRDRQNFTCRATNPAKSDEATSEYGVILPPRLDSGVPIPLPLVIEDVVVTEKIGSTIHVLENQSFAIECRLANQTDQPWDAAEYEWYKSTRRLMNDARVTIEINESESTLTVRNASRNDAGQFRCLALNPAGYASTDSSVFVYSVPMIDKATNTTVGPLETQGRIGSTFIVMEGERLFINCDIADAGGFPTSFSNDNSTLPASVQWFRNGEPVDPELYNIEHSNQLCFDAASLESGGEFTCRAVSRIRRNGEFLQDSATSIVTVVSKPSLSTNFTLPPEQLGQRIIVVDMLSPIYYSITGTRVRVLCLISGVPRANITWSRYNRTTSEMMVSPGRISVSAADGGSELSIPDFSSQDQGVYRCSASNVAGELEAVLSLNLCPALPNCSGTDNFTISHPPNPRTQDNCTLCAYYRVESYGPCDKACETAVRTRVVECISDGRRIDVNVCSQFSEPPPTEETCEAVFPGRNCRDLNPRWSIGSWTKCSRSCGRGLQLRLVRCYIPATFSYIPAWRCSGFRPTSWRSCNIEPCYCEDFDRNCAEIDPQLCVEENVRISCCVTCLREAPGSFRIQH